VVLALDEEGVIRTFNPTGERVFGYAEAEVVGQRVDLLIPEISIATGETVPQALGRLAPARAIPRSISPRASCGRGARTVSVSRPRSP